MTKFSVCVTKGHKQFFLWPTSNICRIIKWNAQNSGRNLCRSTCTTSVLISLRKMKTNIKKKETSPMHVWSRFITIVYRSNRYDSHVNLYCQ